MPKGVQNPSLTFAKGWSGGLALIFPPIFLTLFKILTPMVVMNEVLFNNTIKELSIVIFKRTLDESD